MVLATFAVLGVVLAGLLAVVFFLLQRQSKGGSEAQNLINTLEQKLNNLQGQLRLNLDGNTQIVQQQLGILTKQLDDRLGQSTKQAGEASQR
ncbi:MAG: hypothetical protein Q7T11_01810, partial [Deltaproteobacteria bacterium]|nr:hypothetical protein [Deltaproteobacteria bacterium]